MILPIVTAALSVIGAGLAAWFTSRAHNRVAPADAAQKIADAATDLLEPYREQVTDLAVRLKRAELKLGDVQVQLSLANRRVAALEAQVRSLGQEPVF